MEKKTKILALVLARKGSKRLKNKNVRSLAGKPLICWTLDLLNKKKMMKAKVPQPHQVYFVFLF